MWLNICHRNVKKWHTLPPRRLLRLGCQAPQHKFLATPMVKFAFPRIYWLTTLIARHGAWYFLRMDEWFQLRRYVAVCLAVCRCGSWTSTLSVHCRVMTEKQTDRDGNPWWQPSAVLTKRVLSEPPACWLRLLPKSNKHHLAAVTLQYA